MHCFGIDSGYDVPILPQSIASDSRIPAGPPRVKHRVLWIHNLKECRKASSTDISLSGEMGFAVFWALAISQAVSHDLA